MDPRCTCSIYRRKGLAQDGTLPPCPCAGSPSSALAAALADADRRTAQKLRALRSLPKHCQQAHSAQSRVYPSAEEDFAQAAAAVPGPLARSRPIAAAVPGAAGRGGPRSALRAGAGGAGKGNRERRAGTERGEHR